MIIVNHEKFLASRFDLVIRWHLLEKTDFNTRDAMALAGDKQYGDLRNVFSTLLKMDVAQIPNTAKKVKKSKIPIDGYGQHVARQLFIVKNWTWIGRQMLKGETWIKKNPYAVRFDGLGMSVKRFILALKHERSLYWIFKEEGKVLHNLWKQQKYETLLGSSRYNEIEKTRNRMLVKMKQLEFFSANTYVGDKKFLEIHLMNFRIKE